MAKAKAKTTRAAAKKTTFVHGRWSIRLEALVSVTVMISAVPQLRMNFCSSTFGIPKGARPMIHIRRPSRLNCGNTKRVVSVESVSAEAARFR